MHNYFKLHIINVDFLWMSIIGISLSFLYYSLFIKYFQIVISTGISLISIHFSCFSVKLFKIVCSSQRRKQYQTSTSRYLNYARLTSRVCIQVHGTNFERIFLTKILYFLLLFSYFSRYQDSINPICYARKSNLWIIYQKAFIPHTYM